MMRYAAIGCGALALAMLAGAPAGAAGPPPTAPPTPTPVPSYDQSAIARRGYFYVGGHYVGETGKQLMHEQMYVEVLTPRRPRQRYPLVLIHGAAQTATNWMGTPDGRPGWADFFVRQGYTVYMVDQPARGRSPWLPDIDGKLATFSAEAIQSRFTAPQDFNLWPQARLHTQWPGTGKIGDPIFDAFYATQVPYVADGAATQRMNQNATAALLDRIGPAIILTHSQSGPFGWLIADARPKLVKAVVAVEPGGPPFENAVLSHDKARAWGVTDIPIAYDPPLTGPADLKIEQQAQADGPDLARCWLQQGPARRLVNLTGIPMAVITTEASYHAVYDHCTAKYLAQAGVNVTPVRLADRGIHGNGHMVMLEKNNLQVAGVITDWLAHAVPAH
ncbi:MAG TPA: alpha/beta hydrolase [Stellaceae bacterium]|jgi:pimeloyl-ACP methyl ester carboxylesterase|nr:alpha/beta hydrolase [Stellaceae bacterium]